MAETIEQLLVRYGVALTKQVKDDIKSKPVSKFGSANASGKLQESIRFEITNDRLQIIGLDYIYYIEKGRKPGKAPPRKAIEQWITDKGIVSDISKKSLAFLIQRKIAKEGTTIYQEGGSNLLDDILTPELLGQIQSDLILLFKSVIISDMKSAITGRRIS